MEGGEQRVIYLHYIIEGHSKGRKKLWSLHCKKFCNSDLRFPSDQPGKPVSLILGHMQRTLRLAFQIHPWVTEVVETGPRKS